MVNKIASAARAGKKFFVFVAWVCVCCWVCVGLCVYSVCAGMLFPNYRTDDLHFTYTHTYIFFFYSVKGRENHIYIYLKLVGMSNQGSPCLKNELHI